MVHSRDAELTPSATAKLAEPGDVSTAGTAALPQHGFFNRLYTGTGAFEVIGRRRLWYAISGAILLISLAAILLRGFTFGIDFEGGTKVSMPSAGVTTQQVEQVFQDALGKGPEAVVIVGSGASATVQIRSETLNNFADTMTKMTQFVTYMVHNKDKIDKLSKEMQEQDANPPKDPVKKTVPAADRFIQPEPLEPPQ